MDKAKDFEKGWEEYKAKKKQEIKEMAQCKNEYGFVCGDCVYRSCERYRLAEELYNAGYRKIPENAVVLTRERYEELEKAVDSVQVAISSFTRLETLYKIKCTELGLTEEKVRKETAERFAEMAKSKKKYLTTKSYNTVEAVCIDDIDEICKEITGDRIKWEK